MRLVEIVFEAEIKTFGLSVDEVVEIVKETIENTRNGIVCKIDDWNETGKFRFSVKAENGLEYIGRDPKEFAEFAKGKLEEIMKTAEKKLEYYSMIKPFLNIYSRNDKNGIREVFEEKGIEVIS